MSAIRLAEERNFSVRWEIHRIREPRRGLPQPAVVEVHIGLAHARLTALRFALDGPRYEGDRFSGVVRVFEVLYQSGRELKRTLWDEIDERVASRVLTETRFPSATQLSVTLEELQAEFDALLV